MQKIHVVCYHVNMTTRALKPVDPLKSLETLNPVIAKQWHPTLNGDLKPRQFTLFSSVPAFWVCPVDERHVWNSKIAARSVSPGCPVCNNKIIIAGVNDLASHEEFAHIIAEWHPDNVLTPQQVAPQSNKKVMWRCSDNPQHVWSTNIANRTALGSNCRECSIVKRSGPRDMERTIDTHPVLSQEWHSDNDLDPTMVTLGSSAIVKWQCSVKPSHVWFASVTNRSKGPGCPDCSGRNVDIATKNLLVLFPDIAAQLHANSGVDPSTLNSNSQTDDVLWQCKTNEAHSWLATPHSRAVIGTGCPHCLGKTRREPLTDHPTLVAEWSPSNKRRPEEFTAGSGHLAEWTCSAVTTHAPWKSTILDRTRGRGCPSCAAENFASSQEKVIGDILSALGVEFLTSVRGQIGHGLELDLYLPEYKLAIEFNGVYWHSDRFKKRNYHQAKHLACKKAGIALYQIWEDDFRERKGAVVCDLAARLGKTAELRKALPYLDPMLTETIYAKDTVATSISVDDAKDFLETYHMKGFSSGSNYVGLFDLTGRMRAVVSLLRTSNPARWGDVLITRYATAGAVVSGLETLLAHAEPRIPVMRWVAFSDLANEDGSLYEEAGFAVDGEPLPLDYAYVVRGARVHKVNYTPERFKKDRNLLWADGATERELAKLNGLLRVWDTGRVRYVKGITLPL